MVLLSGPSSINRKLTPAIKGRQNFLTKEEGSCFELSLMPVALHTAVSSVPWSCCSLANLVLTADHPSPIVTKAHRVPLSST